MKISLDGSLKFLLLLLGLSIGLTCTSLAQQATGGMSENGDRTMPMRHGADPDLELQPITELLALTEDQKASMKTVLVEHSKEIDEVFSKFLGEPGQPGQGPNASTRRQMHDAIKAVHLCTYAKIDAILNSDQKAKFAAWKKQQRRPFGHKDDMPPPLDDLLGGQKDRGMRDDRPPSM